MAEPRGGEREWEGGWREREREKPPSLIVSRWSCKRWADWKNSPSRPDATVAPTVPSRAILHFQSSPEQAVKQPLNLHRSTTVPALSALFSFPFILSSELRRHNRSSATDAQRRAAFVKVWGQKNSNSCLSSPVGSELQPQVWWGSCSARTLEG